MAPRIRMAPRKRPSQARSREMVESIVSATARVLVKDGYEKTTTNRVAEVAGVSVGSLYQYFPSKEALVVAVMERHCSELSAVLEARLAELSGAPVPEVARALVERILEMHRVNPRLHKVLHEQVPRIGALALMEQLLQRLVQLVGGYLVAHRDEISARDPELAAFVLVTSVEALIHRSLLARPQLFEDGTLAEEAMALVLRYLGLERAESAGRPRLQQAAS